MKRRYLILALFFLPLCPAVGQDEYAIHPELNWKTIETPHFFIHYHQGTDRTASVVAKIAEEIFEPVTSLYDHVPDQKVSLVIKDYDDYSNGGAYFYDNKIEIWAPALDFDLRGTHNWLRNVITHEFTHIIQIQTSMKFGRRIPAVYFQWLNYESERRQDVLYGYPNVIVSYPLSGFVVPAWFAEGTAQNNRPELGYEYWDSHRDMILRMYALDSSMLTWNQMGVFGKTSLGNESVYNSGFSLVKYISQVYGPETVIKISRNLSRLPELTIDGIIDQAIGKNGKDLYEEWKSYLTKEYLRRTEPIKAKKVEGSTIASTGFGNFYPVFSPDGQKIAYVSNKEADYFGLSSMYIFDLGTKTEKKVTDRVRSALSWSPDGKKIYFARGTNKNPFWSELSDLFVYDLEQDEENQISHGLRAHNPSVSPDGQSVAFASSSDGTMNLAAMNLQDSSVKILTHFIAGEQVYSPKWSPDGRSIVFGFANREAQDIAMVQVETGVMQVMIEGADDSRHPVYTTDGRKIVFASDRTGIYNLYEYDLQTADIGQVTNVLGGAFMPSVDSAGQIAFVAYTSTGFKLNFIDHPEATDFVDAHYLPEKSAELATSSGVAGNGSFNWKRLKEYDDSNTPVPDSRNYKNIFTSLTIVPVFRIDNYNPKNVGIDWLKPGLYFFSSDVLDKLSMFGGAAINRLWERDLFFSFTYRGKLPGFFQLGLFPTVSFEMYNITRTSSGEIELGLDRYSLGVTYGLTEFDLFLRHRIFNEADLLTIGFSHSRYSADIGSFTLKGDATGNPPISVPGSSELYFKGNDLSAEWEISAIAPSRNTEINPVGRKVKLRYDYEMNRFNSTGEYEASETGLSPRLSPFNFHRTEIHYSEYVRLPWWRHTVSLMVRGGTIFGPEVPDFFDFYAGGLIGMRGYPFYAIGGNEIATLNATYRVPVWENIDARFLHMYFDKLYASAHADLGNAWSGDPDIKSFKRDAGFELRLESYSFYSYPTRIFFNGTYGLDRFTLTRRNVTATYGKEWRFYFGILFGFDLQ